MTEGMSDEQRQAFDEHLAVGSGDTRDADRAARQAWALQHGEM